MAWSSQEQYHNIPIFYSACSSISISFLPELADDVVPVAVFVFVVVLLWHLFCSGKQIQSAVQASLKVHSILKNLPQNWSTARLWWLYFFQHLRRFLLTLSSSFFCKYGELASLKLWIIQFLMIHYFPTLSSSLSLSPFLKKVFFPPFFCFFAPFPWSLISSTSSAAFWERDGRQAKNQNRSTDAFDADRLTAGGELEGVYQSQWLAFAQLC